MAESHVEANRHHELAAFLRSRRARLSPEQVGLPKGTRRRTPGLRREEVAMLAGISPEWYTWLEQGRDINVSMQLLESLARVFQLDSNEREHLFLLVFRQPPPIETFSPPTISRILQTFVDRLSPSPACIVDARINVIGWNAAYCAVFGDFSTLSERERNLIWRIFTNPGSKKANEHWHVVARAYLAQFRAGYGCYINDPWWGQRIAELSAASPEFRELWAQHDVLNLSEGHKLLQHPRVGALDFDLLWLQTAESGDVRLLIHTPRSAETTEKIEQLLDASQEMTPSETISTAT